MSRYIDADALAYMVASNGDADFINKVTKLMIDAPSIDIVRCRECKWFDSGKNDSEIWSMCTRHFGKYIDVNAEDFCSYGEREEFEEPNYYDPALWE